MNLLGALKEFWVRGKGLCVSFNPELNFRHQTGLRKWGDHCLPSVTLAHGYIWRKMDLNSSIGCDWQWLPV